MPSDKFHVYRGSKKIDTVFATKGAYTAAEMKRSLVGHDGYPSDIRVTKARMQTTPRKTARKSRR